MRLPYDVRANIVQKDTETAFTLIEAVASGRKRMQLICSAGGMGKTSVGGNRLCLVAALSLACGSRSFEQPNRLELRLAGLLAKQLQPDASFWTMVKLLSVRRRLMSFNDCPGTTHGDVLAVYDRAIRKVTKSVPSTSQLDRL